MTMREKIEEAMAKAVFDRTSIADAVLDAMRKPTPGMLAAARDWSIRKYGRGIGNDAAIGCWLAMIDAAKGEKE